MSTERRPPVRGEAEASARRSFRRSLGLITLGGLLLRLAYVWKYRDDVIAGDGFAYHLLAGHLADGQGFVNAMDRTLPPESGRPPIWPLLLSTVSWFGRRDWLDHQVLAAVVGTLTVVLVALAARQVARSLPSARRVSLIAAALAASYPGFWAYERALLSETLLLAMVALFLWAVYRFEAAPGPWRSALLGLCCGLLALTRSEQALLGVVVIVPMVLLAREVPLARRVGWVALAGAVTVGVMTPWAVYNSTRFDQFVPVTTGTGNAMIAANCDLTYDGELLGYYDDACTLASPASYAPSGPERDRAQRSAALEYIGDHVDQLPKVVAAREGRVLGLYRPTQMMDFMAEWTATPTWVVTLWFAAYYAIVAAAVAGWLVMRRHRLTTWPLLAFVGLVMLSAALTFGETRYRAGLEVPIVVLAAFGLDACLRRWGRVRGAPAGATGAWAPTPGG